MEVKLVFRIKSAVNMYNIKYVGFILLIGHEDP